MDHAAGSPGPAERGDYAQSPQGDPPESGTGFGIVYLTRQPSPLGRIANALQEIRLPKSIY